MIMSKESGFNLPAIASFAIGITFVIVSITFFTSNRPSVPEVIDGSEETPIRDQLKDFQGIHISQERTSCLGACPSYRVKIHGNGTVNYEGWAYVSPSGMHTFTLSNGTINRLIDQLDRISFLKLDDSYGYFGQDVSTTIIHIQLDGEGKRVVLGGGDLPEELTYIRNQIEEAVGIHANSG